MTLPIKLATRFYVARDPALFRNVYNLHIAVANADGSYCVAEPPTMRRVTEEEAAPPFMALTVTEAQALLDALCEAGLRPTQLGSSGELGALRAHLEDMRTLVFRSNHG